MFENFKEKLQKRIETNAVKVPNVSWTKGKGDKKKTYTEDIVIKRSKLPLIGDWARIYPPINEEGKVNWLNVLFGGKKNLLRLLLIFLLLFLIYSWTMGVIGAGKEYLDGSKYVIINKTLFNEYCTVSTEVPGVYVPQNLTGFSFTPPE